MTLYELVFPYSDPNSESDINDIDPYYVVAANIEDVEKMYPNAEVYPVQSSIPIIYQYIVEDEYPDNRFAT